MVKWRRIWTTEIPTCHRQGKWSPKKQVVPWNYPSSSSLLSEIMAHLSSVLKIRDITLPKKGLYNQSCDFSSSHIWMWELDHKEGWAQKNWCFWTIVLEKTLESPLGCKEIKSLNPKRNQPWIFIGRTDVEAEAEATVRWPFKSQLIGKDPDARKDWGQKKQVTED